MEHERDALVVAMQRVNDEQARVIAALRRKTDAIAEMERKSAAMTALNVVLEHSNKKLKDMLLRTGDS
jgi:hypothetical protein